MKTTKLDEDQLAMIDKLIKRYNEHFDDEYTRDEIIDKALIALLEITDGWY